MSFPAKAFEDLAVWRKAHEYVLLAYRTTRAFPKHETYALGDQLRRASVSIPANIAEGYRRKSRADKARFLDIALGSADECRYFLILTRDLEYADTTPLIAAIDEISRMLYAYLRAVRSGS